ncbi:MAG: Zinc-type alcohol dehydrogenase YcjQ [uncultured Rubrobacteraceae bacterium]|uniref:Zinc-type alcohol dehydrogenase YcjQ n=1 Tax=uncultured Rubrobacteraceae bacterium TaxID=349277 RepID=A0A6J4PFZ5_9ACTN|nr:MAG: Zinc-type alcohol dehydrogenase YcjQ [uncultured Rubrobacteraceae bacterium]
MGRVVTFEGPKVVSVREYEDPPLGQGEVRLKTLYSGISAGTEMTAYRGSNPYLAKRWEPDRRLFVEGGTSLEYPVEGWGYEEVGEVSETGSGVTKVELGDVVYGTWGHRSTEVVDEDWAAARRLPPGVDPMVGVFSRIGAIALNAVLDADVHVGEHVAVFGQGVPGLIAAQLAGLNGGTVIAIDGIPRRLELARELGAAHVVDFNEKSPAEEIKRLSEGRGADVSIEISGSYPALHEAIRSTAYNSKVVSAGFFQGDGAGLFLGEEFHHNRINVVCSQIGGLSPALDHRWNVERLEKTVMSLAAEGRISLQPLVTHTFGVDEADEAFRLLDRRPAPGDVVQAVLKF